jgi:hypothetical protein
MRHPLFITAAVLILAACGNNDQTDKTQNVDENLSAENIVANDVTAIDAVTGDAANMAADVNYEDVDINGTEPADANSAKPAAKRPSTNPEAPKPAGNSSSDAETNAAD